MKTLSIAFVLAVLILAGCYSTVPATSTGTSSGNNGNARNWVIIMHGESCGSADDVASNMYVENNHDSATISVVVDITWTANGQPQHENRTVIVSPNSKTLIGCDYRNGAYLKMEIVNAQFN
jgi:hypothetical protein